MIPGVLGFSSQGNVVRGMEKEMGYFLEGYDKSFISSARDLIDKWLNFALNK